MDALVGYYDQGEEITERRVCAECNGAAAQPGTIRAQRDALAVMVQGQAERGDRLSADNTRLQAELAAARAEIESRIEIADRWMRRAERAERERDRETAALAMMAKIVSECSDALDAAMIGDSEDSMAACIADLAVERDRWRADRDRLAAQLAEARAATRRQVGEQILQMLNRVKVNWRPELLQFANELASD